MLKRVWKILIIISLPPEDTWIFPLVEMGQLGIHHDSVVTGKLLSSSLANSSLKLASGYFNLTDEYMNTITHECHANCNILMAHPTVQFLYFVHSRFFNNFVILQANGFTGAKGPAGGIPAAYTLIARNFHNKLVKANQQNRVKLFEYQKTGWSYHAKGLWYLLLLIC